jgi:type VI secretion system protein ImpE
MSPEDYLRNGHLEEALAALQESVRNKPEDAKLRVFLFQLFSAMGQWERALTQLEVLAEMGPQTSLLARVYSPVVQCERLREEIFAGRRAPLLFGEPASWISCLVQANELVAREEYAAAEQLRDKALDEAPATAGKINGAAFAWIADADSRLGPLLEVVLNGRYYWAPFFRISRIRMEAPKDLRDLIWAPAQFQWSNGGEAEGFIPARYPGTEASADGALRLARRTDWIEKANGSSLGLGQRLLTTDQEDYPLLETREIEVTSA